MFSTPVSLLARLRRPTDAAELAAAWARFVDLYTPLLLYWARRLNGEPEPEDLVQDVFLTLVQHLPSFRYDQHGSFRGWLRTLLRNQWSNRRRRRRPPVVDPAVLDGVNAESSNPAEELEENEYRRRLLARALVLVQGDFQPTTWQAFQETAVRGRPVEVVARELDLTAAAVHAAKARVLRRLREELDGLLD